MPNRSAWHRTLVGFRRFSATLLHPRARLLFFVAGALIYLLGLGASLSAQAAESPAAPSRPGVAKITVEPSTVELRADNRQQQLLVTATDTAGRSWDATRDADIRVLNDQVADVADGTVVGFRDGATEVVVRFDQHEVRVPLQARGCNSFRPVHFANDVAPLFSKLGCNSGGCHGKATGQNGFKLSVFSFDTEADFDAIVKASRGRRLFPAAPGHSLLLAKATATIAHGGGQRLAIGSADHELLQAWVAQGTPRGAADAPHLVGLEVSPMDRVLLPNSTQQILATAIYSDGSRRDVTQASAYTGNAPHVVEVTPQGLIHTGVVPGEASITVNYMGQVAAVAIQAPRPRAPSSYPELPVNNRVDELVWAKLRKMGIVPSEPCDDTTFLRRVYLDAIGTLPTAAEVRAFLADTSLTKRQLAIDAVLDRAEYADFWAMKFADILLVDRDKLGERGAYELHRWLREQFATNRPYDVWVRQLITATGNSGREGPVNYYRAVRTPEELARNVSQAFLGVRLECAQCHHHPFERWSQDDFYGLAAYFNGIERKPIRDGRELVYHAGLRETRIPLIERVVPAHPLGTPLATEIKLGDLAQGDPRVPLARWLTAADNPWFARLAANRLWKHFLGRGLVEPEDDLRTTNPATNEPLLAWLAEQLIAEGYDLKATMRLILNSRVYQLSSIPNDTNFDDEQNFSHFHVKRLPAEVLLDAISQVTGTVESFPGRSPGTRAIALWDNRLPSYFLAIFGRPERNSPCECGRSSEPTMSQALHLMNAPEVEAKLTDPAGRVAQLLGTPQATDALIEELTLTALGRPPREPERRVGQRMFAELPRQQAAEDYLWTLLNSYDFLFIQ